CYCGQERVCSPPLCSLQRRGSETMSQGGTPQPGGEPKPIWDPPSKPEGPEGNPPSAPEEDEPEIEETEEQPS
ncbi:hypothetical protein, partial [Methylobacterium nigriterrae]|uniref:hypothetical protein n=1 Tax=Methylobacterium nigriterrae TaxID=3127512 RepID=UPI003D67AA9E